MCVRRTCNVSDNLYGPTAIHMTVEQIEQFVELSRLEREEERLSAARRRLHKVIDAGFASDVTRTRERQISDQRRALHDRIDALRADLEPPRP